MEVTRNGSFEGDASGQAAVIAQAQLLAPLHDTQPPLWRSAARWHSRMGFYPACNSDDAPH